jgi:hypothetical protein
MIKRKSRNIEGSFRMDSIVLESSSNRYGAESSSFKQGMRRSIAALLFTLPRARKSGRDGG